MTRARRRRAALLLTLILIGFFYAGAWVANTGHDRQCRSLLADHRVLSAQRHGCTTDPVSLNRR